MGVTGSSPRSPGGKLPNNAREAEKFFLKNSLTAEVKGSKRHFNADFDWKMDKPDFDFSTPWDCKMNFNIAGEGPNWGTYSLSRDVSASVANKVIKLAVSGDSSLPTESSPGSPPSP